MNDDNSLMWGCLAMIIGIVAAAILVAAFPVHAAIHTDRPTQETAPVASKDQPACLQTTTVMRWLRDDQGKWHILGAPIVGIEPCHG